MKVLICPGVHSPSLTAEFLANFQPASSQWLVFPSHQSPPYSPPHLLAFLQQQGEANFLTEGLIIIAFSAGVVGAIGSAVALSLQAVKIKALIAWDGWGVPLIGNFPIHRFSHDYFTHWSSGILGKGEDSFYAQPAVEHLQLWRSPATTKGRWVNPTGGEVQTTAAEFLRTLLATYQD